MSAAGVIGNLALGDSCGSVNTEEELTKESERQGQERANAKTHPLPDGWQGASSSERKRASHLDLRIPTLPSCRGRLVSRHTTKEHKEHNETTCLGAGKERSKKSAWPSPPPMESPNGKLGGTEFFGTQDGRLRPCTFLQTLLAALHLGIDWNLDLGKSCPPFIKGLRSRSSHRFNKDSQSCHNRGRRLGPFSPYSWHLTKLNPKRSETIVMRKAFGNDPPVVSDPPPHQLMPDAASGDPERKCP